MTNEYYQKPKERHRKDARERYPNLSKEGKKAKKGPRKISKSFWETRAKKLLEYIRNYYLAHKIETFSCFVDLFNPKAIEEKIHWLSSCSVSGNFFLICLIKSFLNFLFYGLVLEM